MPKLLPRSLNATVWLLDWKSELGVAECSRVCSSERRRSGIVSQTAVNQKHPLFGPVNAVWLFLRLPALLRIVWVTLLAGMVLVILGYFRWSEWQSWTGTLFLVAGLTLAVLDCVYRKGERERMAEFMTALIMSLTGTLLVTFVWFAVGVLVFVVKSFSHGPDWPSAARLLHFVAIVFVFTFIAMIPAAVRKTLDISAKNAASPLAPEADGERPSGPPDSGHE